MEMIQKTDAGSVTGWSANELRPIFADNYLGNIVGVGTALRQVSYSFTEGLMKDLCVRRCSLGSRITSIHELIWVKAHTNNGIPILIGIQPSYLHYRTEAFFTPQLIQQACFHDLGLKEFIFSVLTELEALLKFSCEGLCDSADIPVEIPHDYLSLDHQKNSRLILIGSPDALDDLEAQARSYCPAYWQAHEKLGAKVCLDLLICLKPLQVFWREEELYKIGAGDLITLINGVSRPGLVQVGTTVKIETSSFSGYQRDAYMDLNEHDISLNFATNDFESAKGSNKRSSISSDEQFELEIYAGKTRVPFSDLCLVQTGTLIELDRNQLPLVELRINGTPLFEGELVRFQEQVMVQILRRLD